MSSDIFNCLLADADNATGNSHKLSLKFVGSELIANERLPRQPSSFQEYCSGREILESLKLFVIKL